MAGGADLQQRLTLAQRLRDQKQTVAEVVTEEFFQLHPDWQARYGERGRKRGIEDAAYHIDFLMGSIESGAIATFEDYARWVARMLAARGIEPKYVAENFWQIGKALSHNLSDAEAEIVSLYVAAGCAACELPSADEPQVEKLNELAQTQRLFLHAILNGQRRAATTLALEAIHGGQSITDVYIEVFQESQYQLGRLWESNRISVAEEHMATAITQYAISQAYALIEPSETQRGKMIITGVEGEMHQVGANMVADVMETQGWDVRFLGTNMPHRGILQAVEEHHCNMVGISATMVFNLPQVRSLIEDLRERFGRVNLKIIVGGAAFRSAPGLYEEIKADGFAHDLKATIALTRSSH